MKITVLYGSARKQGQSARAAQKILNKIRTPEDEVCEYWLAEQNIKPCVGCMACRKVEVCSRRGDDMEKIYKDIVSADFVIFSSPVYCLDVTGPFKLMFDRLYPMIGGPQGRYTPRYPRIKCCMVMSQGAPTIVLGSVATRMRLRLWENGFENLGVLRYGMGVDLKNEKESSRRATIKYIQRQEKRNDRKIEKIVKKLRESSK